MAKTSVSPVLLAHTKMGRPETLHFTPDSFREEYGTEPKGLIDIKALMGDTSDNIPGVKGIGEKTAKKLISEYHNIETVYEQLETIDVTKSVREKLRAGKESALRTVFQERETKAKHMLC